MNIKKLQNNMLKRIFNNSSNTQSKIVWYHKISVKTALLVWGLVISTLMIFIFGTLPSQRNIIEERMKSEANDIASSIGQVTATAIINSDYGFTVEHCLKLINQSKSIIYIVITRNDGFSLVHVANRWRTDNLKDNIYLSKDSSANGSFIYSNLAKQDVFHYSYPFSYSGIEWGRINVGLSLTKYKHDIADLYFRTILLAVLSIVVGFFASIYFARQLTKPIHELDNISQTVAQGNLDARIKINSHDELGRLANSFNMMTESLQNSQEILEKKVVERTTELEKANLALEEDITKRKEVENELIRAKEIAERSDKLKSEFLAQMSHEIRTPISTMLNYISLIKEELPQPLNENAVFSFYAIDSSSKRLIRTIDMILNMSQIQTGNMECNYSDINLKNDVLENIVNELQKSASLKGLSLNLCYNTDKLIVHVDNSTINLLFTNLIHNAIKYTHEGNILVRVFENDKGNICVDITDTGIGIAEEFQKNLFQPFTQEEQGYTRRYEGNGLGLALVKKYCELNNASITFKSKKGEGTTFTVEFLPG